MQDSAKPSYWKILNNFCLLSTKAVIASWQPLYDLFQNASHFCFGNKWTAVMSLQTQWLSSPAGPFSANTCPCSPVQGWQNCTTSTTKSCPKTFWPYSHYLNYSCSLTFWSCSLITQLPNNKLCGKLIIPFCSFW